MTTAKELMDELANDPEYQARIKQKDIERARKRDLAEKDQVSLRADLAELGLNVKSIWHSVGSLDYYKDALPVFKKHLQMEHNSGTLGGIALAASTTTGAKEDNELWKMLLDMYRKIPSDDDIIAPEKRGLQGYLANALMYLATPERVFDLKKLVAEMPFVGYTKTLKEAAEDLETKGKIRIHRDGSNYIDYNNPVATQPPKGTQLYIKKKKRFGLF